MGADRFKRSVCAAVGGIWGLVRGAKDGQFGASPWNETISTEEHRREHGARHAVGVNGGRTGTTSGITGVRVRAARGDWVPLSAPRAGGARRFGRAGRKLVARPTATEQLFVERDLIGARQFNQVWLGGSTDHFDQTRKGARCASPPTPAARPTRDPPALLPRAPGSSLAAYVAKPGRVGAWFGPSPTRRSGATPIRPGPATRHCWPRGPGGPGAST